MPAREFLDRMGYTVCEPLPFESLKDILRTRVRSRAPHGCCLLSQCGNNTPCSPSKGTIMLSRSDHKSEGFSHNGHTNCGMVWWTHARFNLVVRRVALKRGKTL